MNSKIYPIWNNFNLLIWTLEERRIRADLIEVYKMINGITSVKFESFFEFDTVILKREATLTS